MSESVYRKLADEYDAVLGELARTTWAHGVVRELKARKIPAGSVVLDLGAGTGIGASAVAAEMDGLEMVALDRSPFMLEPAADLYARTVLADFTALPIEDASVDVVVSGFDSLNYLSPVEFAQCLREIARCLREGGLLIFDYSSPRLLRHVWRDESYVQQLSDGAINWEHRWDAQHVRSVSRIERVTTDGATSWSEEHVQYALDVHELDRCAQEAGLDVLVIRNLEGDGFTSAGHTHVWVLERGASRT